MGAQGKHAQHAELPEPDIGGQPPALRLRQSAPVQVIWGYDLLVSPVFAFHEDWSSRSSQTRGVLRFVFGPLPTSILIPAFAVRGAVSNPTARPFGSHR